MATYRMEFNDYSLEDLGYVDVTMSPEPGTPIFPGDTVTINGKILSKRIAVKKLWFNFPDTDPDVDFGAESEFVLLKSFAKNTAGNFSVSYTLKERMFSGMASRFETFKQDESFNAFYITICNQAQDSDTAEYLSTSGGPDLVYGRYRLAPQILAMDFERATADGTWADDGQYFRCKTLKIAINPQAVQSDITKATITCTGSDGSSRSVNLTQDQLSAALTADGYSETEPGIFADFASALGVNYTLTLTLGDDYDQATFADIVMRSFARLHFSGAKNGGVAVGMFSSSTDDVPKFEVADTHESHFYSEAKLGADGKLHGGTEITGVNTYQEGEHATGGHWIDGKPIYRYVYVTTLLNCSGDTQIATLPSIPDQVIDVKGEVIRISDYGHFPFTFKTYNGDGYLACVQVVNRNQLWLALGTTWKNIIVAVVVEYTRDQDGIVRRPRSAMTANSNKNCVASASTQYNTTNNAAWNGFSGVTTGFWASTVADKSPWLQLQMDVALKNISVSVWSRTRTSDNAVKGPISGKIQGSNDGSAWTQIGTFADWPGEKSNVLLGTVKCNNATAYSYVRIAIDTWQTDHTQSEKNVVIGDVSITGDFGYYIEATADPALPEGPEIFADPGVARADYIAMMAGIEIPTDAEAAGDVQADAGGMEPPGIEDGTGRSAKYELVKLYCDAKVWSSQMVRNAVGKWITAEEVEEILGTDTTIQAERMERT